MEEKKSRISLDNKKIWVVGHNGMVGNSILKKLKKYKSNILVTEKKELDLKVNKEIVQIYSLTATNQEEHLKSLITEYSEITNSPKAKKILSNWSLWKTLFKVIVPPSEQNKLEIEELLERAIL